MALCITYEYLRYRKGSCWPGLVLSFVLVSIQLPCRSMPVTLCMLLRNACIQTKQWF